MSITIKTAIIFHGKEAQLKGAEGSAKAFADIVTELTKGDVKLDLIFYRVDHQPDPNLFKSHGSLGLYPRESDLGGIVNKNKPYNVIRVYNHTLSYSNFSNKPFNWGEGAMALTWGKPQGVKPAYSSIRWDTWEKAQANAKVPEHWANIYLHEFLHCLDFSFDEIGISEFSDADKGVKNLAGELFYIKEYTKLTNGKAIPWDRLKVFTGIR